ncbi:MAG: TRAP transporter large permease, partial [Desulfatiglandales bacterium]
MFTALIISFVLLLILGVPISVTLASVTMIVLYFFTPSPLIAIPQQLFNGLDNFVMLSVPFFILAGSIMTQGGMAKRLIDVMNFLIGHIRGGGAIAAILSCLFFAALSGSSPATVVAIGSIMIPALKRSGYPEGFSIGLLTTAGSLGIVIPPSIPMIFYALVMNVSVAELFMAGILPGIMIALCFMIYSFILARKNNWRFERKIPFREGIGYLKEGSWALMLPVIVLGGIYSGIFTPTEAAAISVAYSLFVELLIYKELNYEKLRKA